MNGFKGGIQVGTTAASEESKSLESILTREQYKLIPKLESPYTYQKSLSGEMYKKMVGSKLEEPISGMSPDGGIFTNSETGKIQLISEGKKNGLKGNAVERWGKNAGMAQTVNVLRYVTYCLGEGFFGGGVAQRQLASMLASLDPGMRYMWEDQERQFGFYRFETIEEANERMPAIVKFEMMSRLAFVE